MSIDPISTPVVAPEKGTPEYDAAMAAKYDAHQGEHAQSQTGSPMGSPEETPKPAEVVHKFAGKFNTAEDLEKAYKALEAKLGAPKASLEAAPVADAVDPATPPGDDTKAVVEAAGLDFDALNTEFQANQTLSDASYSKMEKAGIPRSVVDNYIQGQQLLGEQYQNAAFSVVGSADNYQAMIGWAKDNLSVPQLSAFDKSVSSMDVDTMTLAVEGMKSRYEAANGKVPSLIQGSNTNQSPLGFKSVKEQVAATRDPRYKSDPAYRKSVEAKIMASTAY